MQDIIDALEILKDDDNCHAVLFTTSGPIFCEGLDHSFLVNKNEVERKSLATELCNTVG